MNFKVCWIFICMKFGVHFPGAAKCTRASRTQSLPMGPEATPGPLTGSNGGGSAHARGRATPATTAGDVVLRWTRDEVHPVRNYSVNPKTAAPLLCGRRRRCHRQWRVAVPHLKPFPSRFVAVDSSSSRFVSAVFPVDRKSVV